MLEEVTSIARGAGAIVRSGFGSAQAIDFKTNESNLVTETDKRSEAYIIDNISRLFPSHGILAEESGEYNPDSEFVWVVDPLDGTTNFAHGLPIFSVSIGVQYRGETICGAVYDVMQDILYSAEQGSGSFCNGKRMHISTAEKIEHALAVTGFPYDIGSNPLHALEIFTAITRKARGIRRLGSAASDFCYVAKGVFDAFWEVHLHPWDVCAGQLIVEEAGGLVTNFENRRLSIFDTSVLCTNGTLHPAFYEIIHEEIKARG